MNLKDSLDLNHQKTVLITGGSGGIGYEFAKLFARDRYNLVLVARTEQKLIEVAEVLKEQSGIAVKVIAKDLSKPTAVEEIFAELKQEDIKVDILVNNAGFGSYGLFVETDINTELQLMQVNMVALTHLTKLFLPNMLKQKYGKILNVASIAAFQPGPLMAIYYATKAYVLSFSEALANELKGSGVTVTALCPGVTASGFQARAEMEQSKLLSGPRIMKAETVAKIGYRQFMNNQTVVVTGLENKLLAFIVKFVPRSLLTQIVREIQESK